VIDIAAQVSVESRDLVKEDGLDTMNSSDEESLKEEHGDELTGMSTEGCKAPVPMTQSQVARQKAWAAQQRKRAELDACDQRSVQGKMDTCMSQRHPS
jgi:hypothetical protein